jgi:hypothetical protein
MANAIVKDVADSSNQFFDALQGQQQTMFGENQTALDTLSKAWGPVLASGTVPYGYSPGLDSMLQANIMQTSATATSNAENAEALQQKQASGGANVAPTGSNEAINAEILARGQQSEATGLQNEKIAGYQQGLANLEGGTAAENDILNATNPEKAAEAATGAGSLAEQSGAEEFKENQETGPLAIASSITGDFANVAKGVGSLASSGLIPGAGPTSGGGQGGGGGAPGGAGPYGGFQGFHKGGVVKGKKGTEVKAKVLAGETILPVPKTKKQKTLFDRVLANA